MKLFVVSDIHGFFDIFYRELVKKGFKENSKDHLLICCGDYLDRGKQPVEVVNYLMNLNNVILVRGNHEDLLTECVERERCLTHDIHNGTADTIEDINSKLSVKTKSKFEIVKNFLSPFYDKMRDYFETEHYIFVHGWIPLSKSYKLSDRCNQYNSLTYNPTWRNSTKEQWEASRWLNGIDMAHKGLIEPNKTIVCGHWHCSYGYYIDSYYNYYKDSNDSKIGEFNEYAIWEPYYSKGIVAIDRCTAHTKECNILVLEDDLIKI